MGVDVSSNKQREEFFLNSSHHHFKTLMSVLKVRQKGEIEKYRQDEK